jgi:hypothetical protein
MKKLDEIVKYLSIDITKEPPSNEEINVSLKTKEKHLAIFTRAKEAIFIFTVCFFIYLTVFEIPSLSPDELLIPREVLVLSLFIVLIVGMYFDMQHALSMLSLTIMFLILYVETHNHLFWYEGFIYLLIVSSLSLLINEAYSLVTRTIFLLECGIERLQPINETENKRKYERYLEYRDNYRVLYRYNKKVKEQGRHPILEEMNSFYSYHYDLYRKAEYMQSKKERQKRKADAYALIKEMMEKEEKRIQQNKGKA